MNQKKAPLAFITTISRMSLAEKNSFSQRAQAFRKLGEYLQKNGLV